MSASAVSKNPFDLLNDDAEGDEEAAAPAKKDAKDVKKAPAVTGKPPAKGSGSAPSGSAAPASASKDAGKSQGRPPKREYERHSGTGRGRRSDGAEEKRGGSGKYNWGTKDAGTTPGDEADGVERVLSEEEKAAAEAAAEAKRKEEQQMTLDEYLKQKAEKVEVEKIEVRKAETVDMKGLKIKETAADDVWTIGDEDDKGKGGKGKKSGRKATAFTDVNFTTAPIETSGPPGGGRGRGRGRGGGGGGDRDRRPGGGGGGGRGAAGEAASVALADDSAFPSLGK
jgi:plasminogen activator inhibitor 1 RNA-binding protein